MYTVVVLQAVYKAYDRDHSGTIGADELPAAFKAAGEVFLV